MATFNVNDIISRSRTQACVNSFQTIVQLMSLGAVLSGSRRVLSDVESMQAAIEDSDFDFICIDNKTNVQKLLTLGFVAKPINNEYKDITTVDVYEKIVGDIKIQVASKHEKYWIPLLKFWDFLAANPEVFINTFWKRNTYGHIIKANINFMISQIFVYAK